MALVGSGILNLKGSAAAPTRSIEFECEGNYTGDFSLVDAQAIASGYVGSLPVGMTDFYGYSAGSTIVFDFSGSITWSVNTDSNKDGYQALVFSGRESGDVITLNVNSDFIEDTDAVILAVYYSINSTSSWNLILSRSATSNDDVNIPGVDYNDVVRIRVDIISIKEGSGDVMLTLTGGSFTAGSGSIAASGSTEWYLNVFGF